MTVARHQGFVQDAPRRLDKYEIIAPIGQGGMAEVFLARQQGPRGFEKVVVLKTIYPHLAKQKHFIDMFLDEARIAARISDPHVVHIYDLGEADGTLYMAMEYLAGESLSRVVRTASQSATPLPPHVAARIVADVAAGLHTAHELTDVSGAPLEIVHRDVTPGNIVVLYGGGVKIVDFGVAKARGRIVETTGGEVKGKFAYMSPEQLVGHGVDRRSDLFSLGVVLWEALTCTRLYRAESQAETVRLIFEGTPPPPSRIRSGIDGELDRIALRALAKDVADRYQTAEELRLDLESYLLSSGGVPTAKQVASLMRALFPERIAARQRLLEAASRPHGIAAIPTLDDLDVELPPSESSSVTLVTEERRRMERVRAALLMPKRRRGPIAAVAVAALLVAAAGAGGLWFGLSRGGEGDGERAEGADTGGEGATAAAAAGAARGGAPDEGPGARPTSGIVRVDATPSHAEVSIDGKPTGKRSPVVVDEVAPGEHVVEARAPGFEPGVVTVAVAAGRVAEVRLVLRPESKPAPAAAAPPAAAPVVAAKPSGARPPAAKPSADARSAAPSATGTLFLNTKPWAVVYLGSRRLGETPLVGVTVPAGKLKLRAENKDKGIDRTITVDVPPGGEARLKIDL